MARRRLMVLGLDGFGLDLAQNLTARNIMPNLAELMEIGKVWGTNSPLPEVSPVCWSSMFSGTGPGEHGVFGFAEHTPGSYSLKPTDANMLKAPRIWDIADEKAKTSVVLNVPLTYPAKQLQGVMVSGFVTPDLRRGVRPLTLLPRLVDMGYRPEADLDAGIDHPLALAEDLKKALDVRFRLFEQLVQGKWDLFTAVVTDTDRINHFFWPALFDSQDPLNEKALDLYSQVDDFLGRMRQTVEPMIQSGELSLLIAADHGFGPIESEVYLNRWLLEKGYLKLEGMPGCETILSDTMALALDPGRIYLHWADRFPNGTLKPGPKAHALMNEIKTGLQDLRYKNQKTGLLEPVIEAVYFGKDIFKGPYSHLGPDLVCVGAKGYSLRAGLGKSEVFGLSHIKGTHRPYNALALYLGQETIDIQNYPEVKDLFYLMKQSLDIDSSQIALR